MLATFLTNKEVVYKFTNSLKCKLALPILNSQRE